MKPRGKEASNFGGDIATLLPKQKLERPGNALYICNSKQKSAPYQRGIRKATEEGKGNPAQSNLRDPENRSRMSEIRGEETPTGERERTAETETCCQVICSQVGGEEARQQQRKGESR